MLPLDEVAEYAARVLAHLTQEGGSPQPLLWGANGKPAPSTAELAYEGAKVGRRTEGWITASTSANAEISVGLTRLRDRARDHIRNNPHASKALRVFRSHVVGTGIRPKSKNGKAMAIWEEHSEHIDADGHSDASGLMSLGAGTTFESGEVLMRKRSRRPEDGLPLPFQVQVLEPDHLDTAKTMSLPNGGYIFMGVEYDVIGRKVAYWLFPEHPGNAGIHRTSLESKRIPASEVIHSFERWRPGQTRGVPWLAPSIIPMRHTDDWIDADLMRKTVEACIVGFISRPAGIGGPGFGRRVQQKDDEPPHEHMAPGTWAYGRPGEEVRFNDPKGSTDLRFLDERQHAIAAGAGIPYEEMTGNLAQTNFASYRAGRLSFWAMVREFQSLTLIPQVCRRLWQWTMDDARLVGRLGAREDVGKVSWVPPKFPTVNPLQDAMGDLLTLRMGGMTWAQYVAAQGEDPESQLREISDWNKKLDDAKVVVEGDPRRVARTGFAQPRRPDEDLSEEDAVRGVVEEVVRSILGGGEREVA